MKSKSNLENNGLTSSGLEFRGKSGWKLRKSDTEFEFGPSLTVQNQAYSVRDLLRKSGKGLNIVPEFQPSNIEQDFDGIDVEKIANADIFEREQAIINNVRTIKNLNQKAKEQHEARVQAEIEKQAKEKAAQAAT